MTRSAHGGRFVAFIVPLLLLAPDAVAREKLSGSIQQVAAEAARGGDAAGEARARANGLRVRGGRVTVMLHADASLTDADVCAAGGHVTGRSASLVRVEVPPGRLRDLAALGSVRLVREPARARAVGAGEHPAITGATAYHAAGYTGAGVRVAVIDLGFDLLSEAVAAGDLPAHVLDGVHGVSFDGSLQSYTEHGTGVAEVVHDMAPDAEIYCLKVGDELDLENATDYAIAQGCQVINHSVAWYNTSFYDGTGVISAIAESAADAGVLWVNAAGNDREYHWHGAWTDADNDGYLEFTPGSETLELLYEGWSAFEAFITWNDWPASDQDYDVYLVNQNGSIGARSEGYQTGTQEPVEYLSYSGTGRFFLKIRKWSATGNQDDGAPMRFHVFTFDRTVAGNVSAMSILDPAPAPRVVAVGAIGIGDYEAGVIEPFSSWGPSSDGRLKPEIAATDGMTTRAYGTLASYGTSFASPTVAGAAALLLEESPGLSIEGLRAKLFASTEDAGEIGPDDTFGYGKLALVTAPDTEPPAAPTGLVATAGDRSVALSWAPSLSGDVESQRVVRDGAVVATLGASASSYVDAAVAPGTTYEYVVRAVDDAGNESVDSNAASATPFDAPPAAPTNLSATAGNAQVTLAWTRSASADVTAQRVYRDGALVATLGAGATSHVDTGLANGTTYSYVVRVVDAADQESAPSNTATATPQAPPKTHVQSITLTVVKMNGKKYRATATVTIRDQNGNPVSGATVAGRFNKDTQGGALIQNVSATTNASGVATLATGNFNFKSRDLVWFTVTNVAKAGTTYDPAANAETAESAAAP